MYIFAYALSFTLKKKGEKAAAVYERKKKRECMSLGLKRKRELIPTDTSSATLWWCVFLADGT